jgi:hypothetical protein
MVVEIRLRDARLVGLRTKKHPTTHRAGLEATERVFVSVLDFSVKDGILVQLWESRD